MDEEEIERVMDRLDELGIENRHDREVCLVRLIIQHQVLYVKDTPDPFMVWSPPLPPQP